jgi:uncharacterized protein (DUF58 family)
VDEARVISRLYHFHLPGVAYCGTTLVLVLGAINGQNNLLFWIFGLAVAGLILSGIFSGWGLMGLRLARHAPAVGRVGEPLAITYTLRNRNRVFPAFAVEVRELSKARSWTLRVHRSAWQELVPVPATFVERVPRRGESARTVLVTPNKRGVARWGTVRASSTFPMGLTRKSVTFVQAGTTLVRPAALEVDASIVERVRGQLRRRERPRPTPDGDEFLALREYAPGDPLKTLDWRATARLQRPVTRTFTPTRGRRVWVVLDAGALRWAPQETIERGVSLAAGCVQLAQQHGWTLGLAERLGEDRLRVLLDASERAGQDGRVLDILALWSPADTPRPAQRGRPHDGDAVIVIAPHAAAQPGGPGDREIGIACGSAGGS